MREADWRRKQVDVLAGAIMLVAKQTGTGAMAVMHSVAERLMELLEERVEERERNEDKTK